MQSKSNEEEKLTLCDICEIEVRSNEMDEHMKELNNEVFMCPDCELYHNSIEEL